MSTIHFPSTEIKISAGHPSQFPADERPQIAFSGRSNVGKSSLINTLLGRKALARVSSSPGKTVTINFYDVDKTLYFVDLPGYGFAKRSEAERLAFSRLTDGYFIRNPHLEKLRLVVQLVDIRIGPTEDDAMMLRFLSEANIPFLIVASKADKLSKSAVATAKDKLCVSYPSVTVIPFSSQNGTGREALLSSILAAANLS